MHAIRTRFGQTVLGASALTKLLTTLLTILLTILPVPAPAGPVLELDQAVRLARAAEDPAVRGIDARAEALEQRAVADAQLPDPRVTGQIANVPTDSFELDQDNMTQALRLGLRQEFPAGRTLALRGRQRSAQASVEHARGQLAVREIELAVRNAWLDAAWHERARTILGESRAAVAEQVDSLTAGFASGDRHAQDILRAELELARLDDQLTEHRRGADTARAALARHIGNAAFRRLPDRLPALPEPAARPILEKRLAGHPAVAAGRQRIESAEFDVAIAEQAYKPELALEGGYGFRADRPDLATIGVTLSVPLFTHRRQDRRRAAAVRQRSAAEFDHHALLLDLRRQLDQALIDWQRLGERLALYTGTLAATARQTAASSVSTYAQGETGFTDLIGDQLAEIRIRLKRAELETEAARAWARIQYLAGDPA